MKTIVAISTPIGNGGISIVRMSGDRSIKIALSLFHTSNLTEENIQPRKMYLGKIEKGNLHDICLMVYFKAPYSYTGEDIIEFQCHGGQFLTEEIMRACLDNGATLAENGEFTQRAFLNGKMSLDNVEGAIDLINATSEAEIKASYDLLNGKLYKQIKTIQEQLKNLLAELDVSLDYPEHDEEQQALEDARRQLEDIQLQLTNLSKTEKQGKLIKNGINVCIVGKPNAGKSSVLNQLIGEDRAIVTNIEGTTRDVLKETITHNGIKINFLDTAGIRESQNEVEKIGIEKSKQTIKSADIVLFVIDASKPMEKQDEEISKMLENQNVITVINKLDIKNNTAKFPNGIEISALTGKNIDKIKDKIVELVNLKDINNDAKIVINARHAEALKQAIESTKQALISLETNMIDIVASQVMHVWNLLGKITGETETEDILDAIFSKFCLGK